ncbi:MAG: hypothetical protein JXR49_14890, partial [Acidobacteria bacterium]|nr:hypothetical protein [Acidobacteriota bacterium]
HRVPEQAAWLKKCPENREKIGRTRLQKRHDKSHNIYSNLIILCIECHSHQPFHSQVAQTRENRDKIDFIKALRKDQGISDFDNDPPGSD